MVAPTSALAKRLAAAGRFVEVWRHQPATILAVAGRPGFPEPSSLVDTDAPGQAIMTAAEAERPRFAITVDQPTRARIAIAWSPKWYGSLDCRPAVLQRTPEGLIQVDVPAGSSRIDLEFRAAAWDRSGGTVAALLVLLVVFLRGANRTARRRCERMPDRPQDLG